MKTLKNITEAIRLVCVAMLAASAGVGLARNVRGLVREVAEDGGVPLGDFVAKATARAKEAK
jgi:hypothetical protein